MAKPADAPHSQFIIDGLGHLILQIYLPNIMRFEPPRQTLNVIRKALPTLCQKLPHLWGIWLIAGLESNEDDIGFAVRNDCKIDPRYGTMQEFAALISEAASYGVKIGVDVVLNHSAPQNKLAAKCFNGDPGYENALLTLSDKEVQRLTDSGLAEQLCLFGKSLFTRVNGRNFMTTFADAHGGDQPFRGQFDLNWGCPKVAEHFRRVFDFWAEFGVGFARVDCAGLLIKDFTQATPENPLSLYQTEQSYQMVRIIAHDTMLIFLEGFNMADVRCIERWPEVYLTDCQFVLSGQFDMDWDSPKIVPVLGGHDQMTLVDRGYSDRDIDRILEVARHQPFYMADLATFLHRATDPHIHPCARSFDALAASGTPDPNGRARVRGRDDLLADVAALPYIG